MTQDNVAMNIPLQKLHERIDNDFVYHKPLVGQVGLYEIIRQEFNKFAHTMIECTPISREQSIALTHLDEACMMFNASIARNDFTINDTQIIRDGGYFREN